jgi:hypothetical protein
VRAAPVHIFIVSQAAGIDSGEYSFGYLATWSGGGNEARAALRGSAQRIQRAAAIILDHDVANGAA